VDTNVDTAACEFDCTSAQECNNTPGAVEADGDCGGFNQVCCDMTNVDTAVDTNVDTAGACEFDCTSQNACDPDIGAVEVPGTCNAGWQVCCDMTNVDTAVDTADTGVGPCEFTCMRAQDCADLVPAGAVEVDGTCTGGGPGASRVCCDTTNVSDAGAGPG
jgi:hypothetical protein